MKMRLSQLLTGVSDAAILRGATDGEVGEVRDDSRAVEPGDLFVAIPGTKQDGRRFISDALARGAAAVLTEGGGLEAFPPEAAASAATLMAVPHVRHALGIIAANRFGAAPALRLTAVTGTNGKTTTTHVVEAIFAAAGRTVGLVGTVGYRYAGRTREAALTTPGALELHRMMAEMRAAGASDVVMEASSIAIEQGRLDGCAFRAAALTNVTQDHLDYHGTMETYFEAKARLFRELLAKDGVAVLLVSRPEGRRLSAELTAARGHTLTLTTESTGADVAVASRRLGAEGIEAVIATPVGRLELRSPLVGDFNLDNILVAVGLALGHGIPPEAIVAGVAGLGGVPGRLERVSNDAGVLCVVDYAHTPDALERALAVLRPLTTGRLLVVFGCGGDRDPKKRPLMGAAAARLGDVAIVTSDNPRTEDPGRILDMVLEGVRTADAPPLAKSALRAATHGHLVEADRRAAIRAAVEAARPGDTLLIAGKGHEDYQILGTSKIHFDDREEAAAAFARSGDGDGGAPGGTGAAAVTARSRGSSAA